MYENDGSGGSEGEEIRELQKRVKEQQKRNAKPKVDRRPHRGVTYVEEEERIYGQKDSDIFARVMQNQAKRRRVNE